MRLLTTLAVTIALVFLSLSCSNSFIKNGEYAIATVNNNVCKKLQGPVVLYCIFVDSKYTHPWSDYDIRSTLDSVRKATTWLEQKARENNTALAIKIRYHQNKRAIPIVQNFSNRTLSRTLLTKVPQVGIGRVDRWANLIARNAGKSLPPDTATRITTKNTISDRERLIARLRDMYKTDNVALMYFINNYFEDEMSVTLHSANDDKTEYSIVSFKHPSVVTHEFLHLFGALDLYVGPFDKKRAMRKRKRWAMEQFPREVMAFAYRRLDSLEVSPFTKYLIGWSNKLDEQTRRTLLGRKIKLVKY